MPNKKLQKGLPRKFEVVLGICGLIAATPVILASAFFIRLNSSGPVLFRQKRVGLNGEEFTLFKLRTMGIAPRGAMITAADDARVTTVGKVLRKSKIDELPELWNVILGDMSFVGPRPEVPDFVDRSDSQWQEILTHRPGITDPVTLRLRNEEHLLAQVIDKERYYREVVQPYKLRGYLKFIREKSWKTDIRIIGRTLKAIALPQTAEPPSKEEMQWSFVE
jgi:lipopolysaccharide/colanic/teichoic acid biosynthesis glycosyltransferase